MRGRAGLPEEEALTRLLFAPQNGAAFAGLVVGDDEFGHHEALFGVEFREFRADPER